MNTIEVELRKLYLRYVDVEIQAELNLWITEIEPVLQARNLKLQVSEHLAETTHGDRYCALCQQEVVADGYSVSKFLRQIS